MLAGIVGLLLSLAASPAVASAPSGDWWNTDYAWRRKITLTDSGTGTPAATVVSVSFDHAALVSAGKSLAGGDDVRIAYWDGSNWTEVSRSLASTSSWNDSSTQILFKTAAALGASASSDNYYLYFGNSSAAAPTVTVPTARWYKTEQLVEQSTTSTTFTNIPGTTLTFTPGDASETWLIFVSGTIRASSTSQTAAELQLLVNGSAVDYWGHQVSNTTTPNRAGFLIPYRITGVATSQTIQPQFKAANFATAYAGTLRVVAALVPPGGDVQFTENNNSQQLTGTGLTLDTLTFTPSSAGDYMIIGKVSHHETPSTSTVQSWVEDDVGTAHPDAPAGTRYSNARAPWAAVTTVFRRTLPFSSRTFTLKGTSSGSGVGASQWRSTRLMAFRADAWEAAEYGESLAQSTTTSATFQNKVSLTTAAPPALRDYLVIQAERMSGNTTTSTYSKSGELRDGGAAIMRTDHKISYNGSATTGYHHTIGVANVKQTSASVTYDNGFLSPSAVATIQCADSTICSLRYRDTSSSQAADEPVPTVTFTTNSQSADESAGTMTVTAQFSAISAHDVSVPFTLTGTASNPADYTITASPITITAGSTTADITISVVDDAVDEPDQTVIVTMGTPTGAVKGTTTVHTATILDNDVAGVVITEGGGATNVTEGGATDTYTVVLNSQPTANVTITITPDGQSSVGSGAGVARQLTFTSANWSTTQTVTVTAADDPDIDGAHTSTIEHTSASADSYYSGIAVASVTANITDNDTAGVVITESSGSTDVTEGGATDTYTVVLHSRPVSNVTVTITPDSQSSVGGGAGVARQLTFTYANWNTAQTVTITATDDPDIDGLHTSTITHSAASTDADYDGIGIVNVTANITDNDTAGVVVTESSGSTNVTEGVSTDTYTLVLHSRPTGDVTVTVTPDAKSSVGSGAGVARQFTFTYANWNTAQTVTVTVVNDTVAEGSRTSTITHAAASADTNYNAIAITSVTANITDDDIAYANFSLASQSELETTASMTVDVTLSTTSTHDVTVPFTIGGTASTPTDYTITPSPVTITAGQLSTTITITIVDNAYNNPDKTVILTMGSPTNGAKGTVTVHTATIVDDEPPGIAIAESGGSTTIAEGGATDTYTLALQSMPFANVTVSITTDGTTTVNPTSITFTDGDWNTPQTVTVTAIDDAVAEGPHSSAISHTAASGDADYNGITVAGVTATITDNDTAAVTITETDGATNVTEGGATDTYTVVLHSEPTANVTIAINSDGKTSANPASLTFTAGNWSTLQTVELTATDDAIAEGSHASSITHTATSTDSMYNGIAVTGITASITDNDTAGVVIAESGGATNVTEAGGTDTYTVVLHSQPTATVTVSVATDGKTTASPTTVTFTTGDWNTPQTVTLTAVDDDIAQGPRTSSVTHSSASADPNYDEIAVASVTANVADNDTASVTVTESGGATNVTEGGATDTYTVVLHSQPTANVTITINTDGKATASPTPLTFTQGNWSTPQTLTVTAVNDAVAEGAHASSITHAASSADPNYNGIGVGGVTANITDNDIAYVNFSLAAQSAQENAGSMTVNVTLSMVSSNNVAVPFTLSGTASSPADYTVTASPVTVTAGQLSTTITITAVDDFIHEPDETVILTMGTPTNGTKDTVTVHTATIIDDESTGVTITESGGATSATEGGATDGYTLVLRSQPTANVTISVGTDGKTTVNPTSVSFTTGNWNVPQTITVTATDDAVAEGGHSSTITHTASSMDADYNGLVVSNVTATIADNDTAGAVITQSGGTTNVTEGGTTDSYTLKLNSQPTANVTITITPDAQTTVNPTSLTFTLANWGTTQTVVVTAANDSIAEDNHTSTITHTAASTDPFYSGVAISSVTAGVTDNDTAGVTVTESGGSTDVTEGGATDTYNVVLYSQPTADVTVTIGTDGKTTANPALLTFTAGNWSTPQTVTVTAANDAVAEGPHNSSITQTASSTDPMYNGISGTTVTAHITDNDTAGVSITESDGATAVTEGGATDTYDVALSSQPAANVTVTIGTDGKTSVSPTSLTFTSGSWNTPQTVTVTAVDDAVAEGLHTCSITHAATSTDAKYSGVAIAGVTASITDNEAAGITATESGGSIDVTEGGATDSYTLVLTSQPLADVAVTITPDAQTSVGSGVGVARVLTFTAANWSATQTVTVIAADDAVAEGLHTWTIAHSTASADPNYDGIVVASVTANITDNDTAGVVVTESGGTTNVIEAGATDTYTVVLHSKPTANVVITATPGAQTSLGAGGGTPVTLTFTPANWNTPQTIVVAAVDDTVAEGPRTSTITQTAASADAFYNGIGVTSVTAHITDNDTAYVNFSLASQSTLETAGSMTVDVILSTTSTHDVTVPFTLSGTAATPANYTITASPVAVAAGQLSATITIAIVNDFINNVDRTVILTLENPTNGAKGPVTVHTAAIVDDEPPGISITESGGSTTVTEGGASDGYTLVLQSQPLAEVTVTIVTDGRTTVNPASVTFNDGDWNTPQTIAVSAVDDAIAEDPHAALITQISASADPDYNGITVAGVTATVLDNDTAGVTITETGGSTATTEDGANDSYTVVLTSEPTADVTIAITTDGDTTTSPTSLTFTPGNWNTSQTVAVVSVDDFVMQGPRTSTITHAATSADPGYDGKAIGSVTSSVADNDVVGVTISESGGSTNVAEDGVTDSYAVALSSQPTGLVVVTIHTDGMSTANPTLLTFNTTNWNTPQTATVTAVDNAIEEDLHTSSITHTVTSTDTFYNGVTVSSVTVNITDDDTAALIVSESSGSTTLIEGGVTDTYTVVLATQPTATVTVSIATDGWATVAPFSLTFTSANWSTPQTVSVTALNDLVAEGNHTSTIAHTASSADGYYDEITIAGITALITDNDIAGTTLTESDGSTSVTEDGVTDSYTLVLRSEPIADVTVTLAAGADITVNPATLTFTSANWSTPHTVTLAAVDDAIAKGNRTAFVTHTASSADPNYSGMAIAGVTVNIADNDTASVTVTQSGGTTEVTEGGATDLYEIVLHSQPTADVTVSIMPNAQLTAKPASLTFTPGDWNVPRTVVVTAMDDAVAENGHTGAITHTAAGADSTYNGISVAGIAASITDNDIALVSFTQATQSRLENAGQMTAIVALSMISSHDVIVPFTVGGTASTPSDYTITAGPVAIPAGSLTSVLTLTIVPDSIREDDETVVISMGNPTNAVKGAVGEHTITIRNNDVAGVIINESDGSTRVTEGGRTDSYTLALLSYPAGNVTVTISTDGQTAVSPSSITFTQGNWFLAQTVTVTAVDDAVAEAPLLSIISHSASSSDPNYNGLSVGNVIVQVQDDDGPGVVVTETSGSTILFEAQNSDSYTVALTAAPVADVTVTITTDGWTTVTPRSLVFTPANWSVPQNVGIRAPRNSDARTAIDSVVALATTSADPSYSALTVTPVIAKVVDKGSTSSDNHPEVLILEADGGTRVTEGGPPTAYTIALGTRPTANVTITPAHGARTTVNPTSLTFTSADWETPQTIIVTAVDDSVMEGEHTDVITHAVASADPAYNNLAANVVAVTIEDNDNAGVTIVETNGDTRVTEGQVATDGYHVSLTCQPQSNVLVSALPDATLDLGAGPGTAVTLTFTPDNWNVEQTITVTVIDDSLVQGSRQAIIRHQAASSDTQYAGAAIGNVTVQITDNDALWGGEGETDGQGPAPGIEIVTNPKAAGRVMTSDQGNCDGGQLYTLTAMPAEGYEFTSWSGDVNGQQSPLVVCVNRPMRIEAQFGKSTSNDPNDGGDDVVINHPVQFFPCGQAGIMPLALTAYGLLLIKSAGSRYRSRKRHPSEDRYLRM